jgi:hypothetical protein
LIARDSIEREVIPIRNSLSRGWSLASPGSDSSFSRRLSPGSPVLLGLGARSPPSPALFVFRGCDGEQADGLSVEQVTKRATTTWNREPFFQMISGPLDS